MKLDKHVVDMFTELTKPADDVKMEKTCYGTISVVDGTRYVKLDGSDLLVPAASTVKTSHGDRVTVLMKNHSLTVTGNLTAPATDGEGGSSGEAGTAATIEVGTVTTGEAGSSATVTNVGTTSAAVFDFVIPKGDKGEKGDIGPQGPRGEKGDTGTWDGTIPEHEHTVSNITDFPASLPANGGNAHTLDGKHRYDFVNYLGSITDVDNVLNNPEYSDCPYEGVISSEVATSIGLSSVVATEWSIKCFRATEGSGFQIAVPIYADLGEFPKYRIAIKYGLNGGYFISWGKWKNFSDNGNADTLDGLHANEIASNPNLLINPDFKINQRGITSVAGGNYKIYFADRWHSVGCSVTNTDGVISAAWDGSYIYDDGTNTGFIQSVLELPELIGKQVTLSVNIDGVRNHAVFTIPTTFPGIVRKTVIEDVDIAVGNYINIGIAALLFFKSTTSHTIEDVKLETGGIATPFVPPDPAIELAKCQRYYESIAIVGNPYGAMRDSIIAQGFFKVTKRIPPTLTITSFNDADADAMGVVGSTTIKIPIKAYVDSTRFHLDYAGRSEGDVSPCDHNGNVGCIVCASAEL